MGGLDLVSLPLGDPRTQGLPVLLLAGSDQDQDPTWAALSTWAPPGACPNLLARNRSWMVSARPVLAFQSHLFSQDALQDC